METLVDLLLDRGALGSWHEEGRTHVYFAPEFTPLEVHSFVSQLQATFAIPGGAVQHEIQWEEEQDWHLAWRTYFRPVRIGHRLLVRAPWHSPTEGEERIEVVIEPGMAFGTGTHPSTQLSLEALEMLAAPGKRVLDVGTGSGILAIAAAKLGCSPVIGLDIDPLAVDNARLNLRLNRTEGHVRLFVGSLETLAPTACFDLILANLQRQIILSLLGSLRAHLSPAGDLVLAGLIETEEPEITSEMARFGLRPTHHLRREEWVAIVARRQDWELGSGSSWA